jgi:tetratricopeptide (TPR) repeat protein
VEQEIDHYRILTTSNLGLGKIEAAREAAEQMLGLSRHHSLPELEIDALKLLSAVEIALGKHDSGLIHANQALYAAEDLENDELILACLADGAQLRNSMGLSDEGIKMASEGLRRASEQETFESIPQFLVLLRNYGEVTDTVWSEFVRLGNASLAKVRESKNTDVLGSCLANLGELFLERSPETALGYLIELAALYEREGKIQLLPGVYRSIAGAYSNLHLYEEAATSVQLAQATLHEHNLGNKWQRLMVCIELAKIYWLSGKTDESFEAVEKLESELDGSSLEAMSWAITYHFVELRGNLWMSKKEYRLAEMAFEEAFSLLETRFHLAASQHIRLSIQNATAKLSQLLIGACLPQLFLGDGSKDVDHRAFRYIELFRSRLLLAQLGQTVLRPPSDVPDWYLNYEKALIAAMQTYNLYQDDLGIEDMADRLDCWEKLRELWDEIASLSDSAHQYIALRSGDVIEYDSLRKALVIDGNRK